MKINTRHLRTHPLLATVPAYSLRRLMARATLDEFPKGTVLFRAGIPCEAVYLILSGRCESTLPDGQPEAVLGPGDAAGARELLNNEPYRSTVSVATHSSLLRIPAAELERLFLNRPSVAGRFSSVLAGRLGQPGWRFGVGGWLGNPPAPSRLRRRRTVRRTTQSRVVALASLGGERSAYRLTQARSLAAALRPLVPPGEALLVVLENGGRIPSLAQWPELTSRCNGFDGEFCLARYLDEREGTVPELRLATRGSEEEARFIAPLLSHLAKHFENVLFYLSPELPAPALREGLIQSDLAYLFLQQTPGELYQLKLLLADLSGGPVAQLRPVVYLDPSVATDDVEALCRREGCPVHAFVRDAPISGSTGSPPSPAFALHQRRLAREIARKRLGIAFSSGGAKGLAHVGVIQVLEENGIEVDIIAGSSMGAYVGAIWASGHTGETMEKIARELEGRWGLFRLIDPVWPRQGFIRSARIGRRLRRSVGDSTFSELLRPLRVVATHLDTMERIVFASGDVVAAVEASIAIPGVCVPVTMEGETYIDGGIADPLPVDVLVEAGIERILAVNTIPTPEALRRAVDESRGSALAARKRSARVLPYLNRHLNYFARGNILDTMFRSTHGVQMRLAQAACREADLVLRPVASDARWHDFTHPGKYIALGRKVAQAELPAIRRLLHEDFTPSTAKRSLLTLGA